MPESSIAPFLTELHNRERKNGVRVGSCTCSPFPASLLAYRDYVVVEPGASDLVDPMLYKGVHVSLIGLDEARIREIGKEVCPT